MARHALSTFRRGDANSAAIFGAINANLQQGLRAQAEVNNQIIDLSTTIRNFRMQDREFAFRLDNELHNRRRERLIDTLRVAEFNQRSTITNAEIAKTHASSLRTRAQSAARRGDLEQSRALHTKADEMEDSIFAGLEVRNFSFADLQDELNAEGDDGTLRRLMQEVGIELPEGNQPINGLENEGTLDGEQTEGAEARSIPKLPELSTVVDDAEEEEATEPSPAEKMEIIRGARSAPSRKTTGFADIATQEDLDDFVRLAGIDPETKEGQAALNAVIPQTEFGKRRREERDRAASAYLNQALLGATTGNESSIDYYTDELGGSRPLYETASRIGENYRSAQKAALDAAKQAAEAEDAIQAAAFQAKVPGTVDAEGNRVAVDIGAIDANEIETASERAAVAKSFADRKAATRANIIAQAQLQAAEEQYVQFQIDAGLLDGDTIQKLRDAQDRIEEADARPAPEPPVPVGEVIREGGAEISLADFQEDILEEVGGNTSGMESGGERIFREQQAAATSALIDLDPIGRFGFNVTDSDSLSNFRNSRDWWFANQRLEQLNLNGFDPADPTDDNAFENHALTFEDRDLDYYLQDEELGGPDFVPPTIESRRNASRVARAYIDTQLSTFNSYSNGTKRKLVTEALDWGVPGSASQSSMSFSTSPTKQMRVSLGLGRSAQDNLEQSNIHGGNIWIALRLAALTEARETKKLLDDTIIGKGVNFEAFNTVNDERIRRRSESNQPINGLDEPDEPVGPPTPEEDFETPAEIAAELSVKPETLRGLELPEIKNQDHDGAVEGDLEETVAPEDERTPGEVKKDAAAIKKKAEGIVANGTKAEPIGSYGVIDRTRDQIPRFDDLRKQRNVISMDFNHDGKKNSSSRALIVVPNDASEELIKAATDYIRLMSKEYGIPVAHGGKHGKGIRTRSENGRGITRVTHLEGFYGNDPVTVAAIRRDPNKYANILKLTFGRMKTAVFIPPHTQSTRGAATNDGEFETDFALKHIIPLLKA